MTATVNKYVRLDKNHNYLYDSKSNTIVTKFKMDNPDIMLVLNLNGSTLKVDHDNIKQEYGGQLVVHYDNTRFIIDDGYRNTMVKAGYIVYKNYDQVNEFNEEKGKAIRDSICTKIQDLLNAKGIEYSRAGNNFEYILKVEKFHYTVTISTVSSIVNKNKQRKINSLPFYPFDKSMDKYGTMFLGIFAEKQVPLTSDEASSKFDDADEIIKDLIVSLGTDFHYVTQEIKHRLIYWRGI